MIDTICCTAPTAKARNYNYKRCLSVQIVEEIDINSFTKAQSSEVYTICLRIECKEMSLAREDALCGDYVYVYSPVGQQQFHV